MRIHTNKAGRVLIEKLAINKKTVKNLPEKNDILLVDVIYYKDVLQGLAEYLAHNDKQKAYAVF